MNTSFLVFMIPDGPEFTPFALPRMRCIQLAPSPKPKELFPGLRTNLNQTASCSELSIRKDNLVQCPNLIPLMLSRADVWKQLISLVPSFDASFTAFYSSTLLLFRIVRLASFMILSWHSHLSCLLSPSYSFAYSAAGWWEEATMCLTGDGTGWGWHSKTWWRNTSTPRCGGECILWLFYYHILLKG